MTAFQFDGTNYSSARAAGFAHAAWQHRKAQERRRAGRQSAHDAAASARAAEKRAAKLHEIANRPRGRTEVIDGRPVYRAVPAFRARPYTPPEQRKERQAPVFPVLNGARLNVREEGDRIAAALKAEAPQPLPLQYRMGSAAYDGEIGAAAALDAKDDKRIAQRAARKSRMARIRRRGW